MKTQQVFTLILVLVMATCLATPAWSRMPTYKMTTEIPHQITTPDKVQTPIGTLEFFDGIPVGAVSYTHLRAHET